MHRAKLLTPSLLLLEQLLLVEIKLAVMLLLLMMLLVCVVWLVVHLKSLRLVEALELDHDVPAGLLGAPSSSR